MRWQNYETQVATVPLDASVRRAADLMDLYAIGCVMVVDPQRQLVGIVTDRDLCCRVIARGADPDTTKVSDVATTPVHLAQSAEPLERVAARMREAGVRRMPVIHDGELAGLVTLDDLIVHLGRELDELGSTAKRAIDEGRRRGRRAIRRQQLEESIASLEANAVASGREAIAFVRREIDSLRERLRKPDAE